MGTAASSTGGGCHLLTARPESRAFLEKLKGFLAARDRADLVAKHTMGKLTIPEMHRDVTLTQTDLDFQGTLDQQLDLLYQKAHEANMRLGEFCVKLCRDIDVDPHREMLRQRRPGKEDKVFYAFTPAPLKGRDRAVEKVKKEYGGDARHLVDIVRASIVLDSEDLIVALLSHLRKHFWGDTVPAFLGPSKSSPRQRTPTKAQLLPTSSTSKRGKSLGRTLRRFISGFSDPPEPQVTVVRYKDRFTHPTFSGYRDALLNLRIPLGGNDGDAFLVELQIHHKTFIAQKAETHSYYEYFRTYFAGNVDVVAERMRVLEDLAHGCGGATTERLYADAIESKDERKIRALDDLLDKLSELELRHKVCERLVDVSLELYGEESTDYAMALANFAELLRAKNAFDEAEPRYRKAVEICEQRLGPDHRNVAAILNNLALCLTSMGLFQEAETLFAKSLKIREDVFGKDHLEVAQSLNNMALLLKTTGRDKEAIPCYQRAIDIKELNDPGPSLATSLINLGSVLSAQGDPDAAAPHFERAFAIAEQAFGRDHPTALTARAWIGDNFRRKGQTTRALEILEEVLASRQRVLGQDHQDVASALSSVAGIMAQLGRHDEAKDLYEQSLAIREKLSDDHPDVAKTLNSLARLCKAQNKLTDAEPFYRRSLQIRERSLGGDHPSVAESANNLAGLLAALGQCPEATSHYYRAVSIWERTLGPAHPDLATTLNNLALILWRQDKVDDAIPLQEKALGIRQRRGDTRDAQEYQGELVQMINHDPYPYE